MSAEHARRHPPPSGDRRPVWECPACAWESVGESPTRCPKCNSELERPHDLVADKIRARFPVKAIPLDDLDEP